MKKIYFLLFVVLGFLNTGSAQYLMEDFEAGMPADWVAENDWRVGTGASMSSDYFGFEDHTKFAGVNDDALGGSGDASGKLITKQLDLSTAEHLLLSFDLYYGHANYNGDGQENFTVLYSEDDQTWNVLYDVTFSTAWSKVYVDASMLAGKSVKLAFEYMDGNNWNFGAGIDNILLEDQPEYFGVAYQPSRTWGKINSPEEAGIINFSVLYLGSVPATNASFQYTVDGGETQTVAASDPINSGEFYTFDVPVSGLGYHNVLGKVFFSDEYALDLPEIMVEVVPPVPSYVQKDVDNVQRDLHADLAAGKVVVLDFFASWCVPCETATPLINDVWESLGRGEANFEVYGITVEEDDNATVVKNLNWGGEYPAFAYDERNELLWEVFASEYNQEQFIPFFIMICPNGGDARENIGFSEVIWSTYGWPEDGKTQIENAFGTCDLSPVLEQEISKFEMFPNPFEDYVDVQFELEEEMKADIYLTDNFGKTIRVLLKGENIKQYHKTINLGDLEAGIYYFTVETAKGNLVKKLVRM